MEMIDDRRWQRNLWQFGPLQVSAWVAFAAVAGLRLISPPVATAQSTDLPPPPLNVPAGLPPVAPSQALPLVNIAPAASSKPKLQLKGYRVYVNGDSLLLLQQVQAIVPQALVQSYQGRRIIQVGLFSNEANAQQQVALLTARGIQSELSNELVGNALASQPLASGYYVVIPANQADLPQVQDQALRLGVPQYLLALRDRPLGPHVMVGPFPKKQDAEEVEKYLRQGGLSPRVYFDR